MERVRPSNGREWAPTSWRPRQGGQVGKQKECDRLYGTHKLDTILVGTAQDTEKIRLAKEHSHPRDRVEKVKSGGRTNATQ